MLALLHMAHRQCTLSSPLCYSEFTLEPGFKTSDIDAQKITMQAYQFNFKEQNKNGIGTVDHDPVFWTSVFFNALSTKRVGNSFRVPNGC